MIVVPLIPTTLSVRTLDQLTQFVAGFNGRRPDVVAFFSMVDRRKTLHRDITENLSTERPEVAATAIPALSVIEKMSVERTPVTVFAPRSSAARAYRSLWAEIRSRGRINSPDLPDRRRLEITHGRLGRPGDGREDQPRGETPIC